jgi:hypothetical protein
MTRRQVSVFALLFAAVAMAQNCSTGLFMIVARASVEKPGTGIIGAVAQNVSAQIAGSSIVAVDYPATLTDYVKSETSGVAAMKDLVLDYYAACPKGKMVLMGYSQGAQVTADVACGATELTFPSTTGLAKNVTDNSKS